MKVAVETYPGDTADLCEEEKQLRSSFKRAGLLMMALVLALAGTVLVAGPASAVKLQNRLISAAVTQGCADVSCVTDAVQIPARTFVDTYCFLGDFNVTYTGPGTGRGGFVDIAEFQTPGLQFTPCDDAGIFARVGSGSTNLRSCSGLCVNFGNVPARTPLRAFCELSSAPRWFLVYVDSSQRSGFVSESALEVVPNVPSCNSPF
jgi:hypothetical protein